MVRQAARLILLSLLCSGLAACSLYKSSVRKDFESQALPRVATSAFETCEILSAAENWLQREFPPSETELLVASPEVEVWKSFDAEGRVILRTLRPTEEGTQSCERVYESEEAFENDFASALDVGPISRTSP
jgi:hypothetical protein